MGNAEALAATNETVGPFVAARASARAKVAEVITPADEGLQRTEIAERLDIGVASVYRVLAEAKKDAGARKAAP